MESTRSTARPLNFDDFVDTKLVTEGSLSLPKDSKEAKREVADLLAGVKVKELGGKKGKDSYRITFEIETRDGKRDFVTITTHKQSLKSSLTSMQVMRGFLSNLTFDEYKQLLSDKTEKKFKAYQIREWMNKEGTKKWGLMLYNEDTERWHAFKRVSSLGIRPALATFEETRKLPANQAYAAFDEEAPVMDSETKFLRSAGFWTRLRHNLSKKKVMGGLRSFATSIPTSKSWLGRDARTPTHRERIDETTGIVKKLLKEGSAGEAYMSASFEEYKAIPESERAKADDNTRYLAYGLRPEDADVSEKDAQDYRVAAAERRSVRAEERKKADAAEGKGKNKTEGKEKESEQDPLRASSSSDDGQQTPPTSSPLDGLD